MSQHKRLSQPQIITRNQVVLQIGLLPNEDSFWGVRRPVAFVVEREVLEDVHFQLGADLDMRGARDGR